MILTTLLVASLLASGSDACDLPTGRKVKPCGERIGHCIDVEIDGQRVVPLIDSALRAKLSETVGARVCWMLPQPTAGALDTKVIPNEHTPGLGTLREGMELVVTGLDGQVVPTRKGIRTDPTVRIGGIPMQTVVDVIDSEALPAGAYVVKVRVVGNKGLENKHVYLRVAEPTAAGK